MGSLSEEVRTEVLCGHICDLEAENAKLRDLCEQCVVELYVNGNVTDAATENLFDDMRELGMKVGRR